MFENQLRHEVVGLETKLFWLLIAQQDQLHVKQFERSGGRILGFS